MTTPLTRSSLSPPNIFPPMKAYPYNPSNHSEKYLQEIGKDTLQKIEQGFYLTSKKERIFLQSGEALAKKSRRILIMDAITDGVVKPFQNTTINVICKDYLAAAYEQVQKGNRVLVINFASPHCPGGGFLEGYNGQEENLCYRTELAGFMHLQAEIIEDGLWKKPEVRKELMEDHPEKLLYPLCPIATREGFELKIPEGAVLIPDVTVFRADPDNFYELLDVPFKVDVLSIAAPDCPPLIHLGTEKVDYAREDDRRKIKSQILTQLLIASKGNYEVIVMGAFGCGAFKNPPRAVAQLYQEIIENHFKGALKEIVFAILDHSSPSEHNPKGNLKPFIDAFQQFKW